MTETSNELGNGAAVYVDMSDGMNYAYATPESREVLQAIINKLAANKAIDFFELADSKIMPLQMSHTELYNYMLNPKSYARQKAPIEKTLDKILENMQPALLMTDYEEYKGMVIEQAAYAKADFIKWLAMGYNIYFYKWDFVERGKEKHMFLTVFDDNLERLNSLVANAVQLTHADVDTYVLGSREFAYPTFSNYPNLKQGGNYHYKNSEKPSAKDGVDVVTAIIENGGPEAYVSYAQPYATATGDPGKYTTLNQLVGTFAEYYPLGVTWAGAIKNARDMQDPYIPDEARYTHLLQNIRINFGAQDGYDIKGIEVRTFNMQETMKVISYGGDSIDVKTVNSIEKPEIHMILTADMEPSEDYPAGWENIYVDLDEHFTGIANGEPFGDLLRANLCISSADPDIAKAEAFFMWPGNPSLANSVKETLTASTSSPVGRILFTYYIKAQGK